MTIGRRRVVVMLVAAMASCAAPPPPPPKKPAEPPADTGLIRTARYTLHYEKGYRRDAERFQPILDKAIAAAGDEFRAYRPRELLQDVVFDVFLESGRPFDRVSLEYSATGGRYKAKLRLLSPSLVPADATTWTGEPLDDAYYFRISIEKYAAVLLDVLLRAKPSGWTFYSAPAWFVLGYQAYLGLVRSPEPVRAVTWSACAALFRENPNRIRSDLTVTDIHIDGTMLVLFMHEKFGTDRVQAVLLRPEVEFPDAVVRELGLSSMGEFYRKWREWLRDWLAQAPRGP